MVVTNDFDGIKASLALHGVDLLTTRDKMGRGPLLLAARKGHVELIGCLVDTGLPIGDVDSYGLTALHHGVLSKRYGAVAALLAAPNAAGAATQRDCERNTPLALARTLLRKDPTSDDLQRTVAALELLEPPCVLGSPAPAYELAGLLSPRDAVPSAYAPSPRPAPPPIAALPAPPSPLPLPQPPPPPPPAPLPQPPPPPPPAAAAAPARTPSSAAPAEDTVAAFHAACHAGDERAVRFALADAPALLRAPEAGTGFSPLVACLLGGEAAAPALRALKELLQPGDLRTMDASGRTPLHVAAKTHTVDSDALAWLLSNGVPPSATDCDGATPLHEAVRNLTAPAEAVGMLLAAGAAKGAKDGKGRTPGDVARVLAAHGVMPCADRVLAALI
jgi:hypothetical protein